MLVSDFWESIAWLSLADAESLNKVARNRTKLPSSTVSIFALSNITELTALSRAVLATALAN